MKRPIFILIAVNVLIGFFIFRDYGLAWDEPYFYSYADALGYAYSPANWLRADFDLNNSYGASGEDHKTRGPAYLLLARSFVYGVEALGFPAGDSASAWHLVNFLFFQLGVYFLYRLTTRWMSQSAAFASALLFSTQPLLWGHAFINPKDPPFLTFFLASVCLGFEMVDAIAESAKDRNLKLLMAASVLGIATSIRVLGPLAGLLVMIYFIARLKAKEWKYLAAYAIIAILIMFLTWPYLWENPFANFVGVFRLMSDNPTNLAVLFNGQAYRAGELPLRYLPFMLIMTLTEPVWVLFLIGLMVAYWRFFAKPVRHATPIRGCFATSVTYRVSLTLMLLWFLILLAYVFLRRPAMYDGFRHFLFILPPVFIFIGFGFEWFFERLDFLFASRSNAVSWLRAGLVTVLILPGIMAIVRLHPYEYTYYNSFIGGTDGAFRNYETDYWLTCYKETVERLNNLTSEPVDLYVKREAYVAAPYANQNITVHELRDAGEQVQSGDYVLVNTRLNDDRSTFRDAVELFQIKRGNATFCILRQIP
ncbi:MAG TPA: glycosyltransferase family 39 protein [Anaerolineales bacterium]|nr:glycosyltransferase family 39 protein [Anaerolineales bacterium]